jgi:hypothetical protein
MPRRLVKHSSGCVCEGISRENWIMRAPNKWNNPLKDPQCAGIIGWWLKLEGKASMEEVHHWGYMFGDYSLP